MQTKHLRITPTKGPRRLQLIFLQATQNSPVYVYTAVTTFSIPTRYKPRLLIKFSLRRSSTFLSVLADPISVLSLFHSFFGSLAKWVHSCWLRWPRDSASWPVPLWLNPSWTRSPWPAHLTGAPVATERVGSRACARGGRTAMLGAGPAPARAAWRVAAVEEPVPVGPSPFSYRFVGRTDRLSWLVISGSVIVIV